MKLTRSTLQLEVDGRGVTIAGEAYLPGHGSPDFLVYADTIRSWDDGTPVSADERFKIIRTVTQEAEREGLNVVIE